jgi:replicative DNA helicase
LLRATYDADGIPTAIQAEQELLGALIVGNAKLADLPGLMPEWFADPIHSTVFRAVIAQAESDQPIDGPALLDEFENSGALDDVGGGRYIIDLSTLAAADAKPLAAAVRDAWLRRQLIDLGSSIVAKAFDGPGIEALHHGLRRIAELAVMP